MLCERCKKNQATVHVKQVINGDVKEMYLCNECADKAGMTTSFSFNDMFKDLFNVTADNVFLGNSFDSTNDRCPVCGQTYNEFRQSGKIGCGECIKHFGQRMDSLIKSIHGSSEHKGKIPHKSGGALAVKREKETLKRKLAVAIENEEFEEAAKIRDEIRSLEKDGE